jgi:hypothetical protein
LLPEGEHLPLEEFLEGFPEELPMLEPLLKVKIKEQITPWRHVRWVI